MLLMDLNKFSAIAKNDPEFKREMRYFMGSIKLTMGEEVHVLKFQNGALVHVEHGDTLNSEPEIFISGENVCWERMLEKYPKPFYHSLQSTAVKHGLKMSTTTQTFAYLPALNRMMQIFRDIRNGGNQ